MCDTAFWVRPDRREHGLVGVGTLIVIAVACAWLFARPSLIAPFAQRAGLAPPSLGVWRRAAVLSIIGIGAPVLLLSVSANVEGATVSLGTMGLLLSLTSLQTSAVDAARSRACGHRRGFPSTSRALIYEQRSRGLVRTFLSMFTFRWRMHSERTRVSRPCLHLRDQSRIVFIDSAKTWNAVRITSGSTASIFQYARTPSRWWTVIVPSLASSTFAVKSSPS